MRDRTSDFKKYRDVLEALLADDGAMAELAWWSAEADGYDDDGPYYLDPASDAPERQEDRIRGLLRELVQIIDRVPEKTRRRAKRDTARMYKDLHAVRERVRETGKAFALSGSGHESQGEYGCPDLWSVAQKLRCTLNAIRGRLRRMADSTDPEIQGLWELYSNPEHLPERVFAPVVEADDD